VTQRCRRGAASMAGVGSPSGTCVAGTRRAWSVGLVVVRVDAMQNCSPTLSIALTRVDVDYHQSHEV